MVNRHSSWTEGHTERWHRMVKTDICGNRKLSLGDFFVRMSDSIRGRTNLFLSTICRKSEITSASRSVATSVDLDEVCAKDIENVSFHTPMLTSRHSAPSSAALDVVVNKGHPKKRRLGCNIKPMQGYLRVQHGTLLLRNGGQICNSLDRDQQRVLVRVRNTCTIDNLLMVLYLSFKENAAFANALRDSELGEAAVLLNFAQSMAQARSMLATEVARWQLIRGVGKFYTEGRIWHETKGIVVADLFAAEEEIVNEVLGDMRKIKVHSICANAHCRDGDRCIKQQCITVS